MSYSPHDSPPSEDYERRREDQTKDQFRENTTTRLPNCRIFLGNLASERTSKEDLYRIFSKYGNIIEEIVMRRSFGFIQYDNPESALAAIQGENGRVIGGMRLDLNLADNREPKGKRSNKDRKSPPRQSGKRRRRSPSPPSKQISSDKRTRQNQIVLAQILYLGPGQRDFAERIERIISREVTTGFSTELSLIERRGLNDALDKAERRGLRYVLVVNRQNEQKNTCTLHVFQPMGKKEVLNEVSISQAVDIIRNQEQILTQFLASNDLSNLSNLLSAYVPNQLYGSNPILPAQGMFPPTVPTTTTSSPSPTTFPYSAPVPSANLPPTSQYIPNQSNPPIDMNAINKFLTTLQMLNQNQIPAPSPTPQPVPMPFPAQPTLSGISAVGTASPNVSHQLNRNSEFLQNLLSKIASQGTSNPQQSLQTSQVTRTPQDQASVLSQFLKSKGAVPSSSILPIPSGSTTTQSQPGLSQTVQQSTFSKQNQAYSPNFPGYGGSPSQRYS